MSVGFATTLMPPSGLDMPVFNDKFAVASVISKASARMGAVRDVPIVSAPETAPTTSRSAYSVPEPTDSVRLAPSVESKTSVSAAVGTCGGDQAPALVNDVELFALVKVAM